jgi:regulator of replication initiation timing
MNKLIETFKKFLPEDQLKEVSAAVDAMMQEAVEEITSQKETEFNKQLENAYNELSAELQSAEKTAEQGYEEAFSIIADLRNRLEVQREEFEKSLEEGFEEAYQMLLSERAKNGTLEVDLYEEYEKKYLDLKEQFVEMLHEFLNNKGAEIYEQARRDTFNDPRYAEHKVALDKIAEIAASYLNGEEVALATSSKLEETYKQLEEMKGQIKVMEARNIRLARENEKLNESVSHSNKVVTESRRVEKKERVEKGKSVSGRGAVVTEQETRVIAENNESVHGKKDTNNSSTLLESLGLSAEVVHTLAGTKRDK